jgi:cell division protein FtsN
MPRLTTRDYKRSSGNAGAAKLREFGLGVLVGAVLASAAFVFAGAHARHRAAAAAAAREHAGDSSQRAASQRPAAGDTGSATPAASPAQSASSAASGATPAPQYDFYRMLPRLDVPVPHANGHAAQAPKTAPAARPAAGGSSYILQVGSYLRSAEADQVRARLARAGFDARVDRVVAGSRTWHRVRIGPVSGADLAKVRARLEADNIHVLTIRVGP